MSEKKPKNVFVEGPILPTFIADSIAKHSTKKDIGAHSLFLGQVRNDQINEKQVVAIEYSAYREMAEESFHQIRERIGANHASIRRTGCCAAKSSIEINEL